MIKFTEEYIILVPNWLEKHNTLKLIYDRINIPNYTPLNKKRYPQVDFRWCFSSSLTKHLESELYDFNFIQCNVALPTNYYCQLWSITNNPLCPLCGNDPESYVHLFYNCSFTDPLIEAIYNLIDDVLDTNVTVTFLNFFFFQTLDSITNHDDRLVVFYLFYALNPSRPKVFFHPQSTKVGSILTPNVFIL